MDDRIYYYRYVIDIDNDPFSTQQTTHVKYQLSVIYPDGYLEIDMVDIPTRITSSNTVSLYVDKCDGFTANTDYVTYIDRQVLFSGYLGQTIILNENTDNVIYRFIIYQNARRLCLISAHGLDFGTYDLTMDKQPIDLLSWGDLYNCDFGHNIRTVSCYDAMLQILSYDRALSWRENIVLMGFDIGLGNYSSDPNKSLWDVLLEISACQCFPQSHLIYENTNNFSIPVGSGWYSTLRYGQFDGLYKNTLSAELGADWEENRISSIIYDSGVDISRYGKIRVNRAWYYHTQIINGGIGDTIDVDFNFYPYNAISFSNPDTFSNPDDISNSVYDYYNSHPALKRFILGYSATNPVILPPDGTGSARSAMFWTLNAYWHLIPNIASNSNPCVYRSTYRYPIRVDLTARETLLYSLTEANFLDMHVGKLHSWGLINPDKPSSEQPWIQSDGNRDEVDYNVPFIEMVILNRDLDDEWNRDINRDRQIGIGTYVTSSDELGTRFNARMGTGITGYCNIKSDDLYGIYENWGFKQAENGHRLMFSVVIPAIAGKWILPECQYISYNGINTSDETLIEDDTWKWDNTQLLSQAINNTEYIINNSNWTYRIASTADLEPYEMLNNHSEKPEFGQSKPTVLFKEQDIIEYDLGWYALSVKHTARALSRLLEDVYYDMPFITSLLSGGVIRIIVTIDDGFATQNILRLNQEDYDRWGGFKGIFNAKYFVDTLKGSDYPIDANFDIEVESEPITDDTTVTGQILNPLLFGNEIKKIKTPYGFPWYKRSDGVCFRVVDDGGF